MSAIVVNLDTWILQQRLRQSLDVNACVARAQKLRMQARDLTAAGMFKEAAETLVDAERAERHGRALVAARELAKGER